MMSDARILAHIVRMTVNTFSMPKTRRDLAATLRNVRNTTGRKAAQLALAEMSSRWLTTFVKGEE